MEIKQQCSFIVVHAVKLTRKYRFHDGKLLPNSFLTYLLYLHGHRPVV